jgi:hypothetical protein
VSAEGTLDSQGLSPADIWAVCYNETANAVYDSGIRVQRSRVVQVSGHKSARVAYGFAVEG